jgi:peroxiredoxin
VPDVRARDLAGKNVILSSLYSKAPILLAFYRGGWCPYCNSEIHALTVAYPELQRRGVVPVAISVNKPDAEATVKASYAIPFPVLSDGDAMAIEATAGASCAGRTPIPTSRSGRARRRSSGRSTQRT